MDEHRFMGLRRALLLALALSSAACTTAQPLPDRWPLHGRVVDLDGHPVVGAMVTLSRQDSGIAVAYWGGSTGTDAKGQFTFPSVEEGSYLVRVDPTSAGGLGSGMAATRVDVHGLERPVEVVLKPQPRLHILKPDGEPLTAAPVRVVTVQGDAAQPHGMRGMSTITTRTDANGDVPTPQMGQGVGVAGVADLTAITMAVAQGIGVGLVTPAREADPRRPVEVRLHPGGTLHFAAREAGGGTETMLGGARLQLAPVGVPMNEPAPELTAPGRTRAADFYRLAGENVGQDVWESSTIDGTGASDVTDLLPGTYEVALVLAGYRRSEPRTVTITAGQTTTASFSLESILPQATLDVDLHAPVPADDERTLSIMLTPAGDGARSTATGGLPLYRRAAVSADGHIRLYPVPPGRWLIRIMPRTRLGGYVVQPRATFMFGAETVVVEAPRTYINWEPSPQP